MTLEVDEIDGEVRRRSILDALDTQYPMLRGTIRLGRAQAVFEILCLRRGCDPPVLNLVLASKFASVS